MAQLVLNIEQPAVLPILKKLISIIDGVTIVRPTRKVAKDEWLTDDVKKSIARGEADIASGRCKQVTASEVRSMLGV